VLNALKRVARAKRAKNATALNEALEELQRLIARRFQARLRRAFDEFPSAGGYLKSEEDVCDALNELLTTLWKKIETFQGKSDGEAENWLNTIVDRAIIDRARKRKRRAERWRRFFAIVSKEQRAALETVETQEEA